MLKAVGTCDHARQVALRQALAAGLDVVRCATSTFSRDIADPASPAASRVSRLAEIGPQYHLPRAKPPKAMSPIRAMITPSHTLQKIATTIPTITMMPPRDMPPMRYLPV
jgi:hypothetical protein